MVQSKVNHTDTYSIHTTKEAAKKINLALKKKKREKKISICSRH